MKDQEALLQWYSANKRELPWRGVADPYAIWISEVMLQQTTVTAVIPYYERFLKHFPTVQDLANAKETEVLQYWAGLGYYSRARKLHSAAQKIARNGFPIHYTELLKLPGFGPYTARSVASLAFGESVGVVDGNVIRVLCRRHGLKVQWWKPKVRMEIQKKADELVAYANSSDVNQALMDLGSTVCSAKSPRCLLCPWMKNCEAFQKGNPESLPLARPKKTKEIWIWEPHMYQKGKKVYLTTNDYAPFLKGQWLPPGRAVKKSKAPQRFLFRHSITHHDIFVIPHSRDQKPTIKGKFVDRQKVGELNPTSLIKKLLDKS